MEQSYSILSSLDISILLTPDLCFIKMLAFLLSDVIHHSLWITASFVELFSGVPFSDFITLHNFRSSPVLDEFSSIQRQACLMAILASWQASNHSFLLIDIFFLNLFIFLMELRTAGVTKEIFPIPGFVLPTCFFDSIGKYCLKFL